MSSFRALTLTLALASAPLAAGMALPAAAQTAEPALAIPPARLELARQLLEVNGTRAQTEQGLKDVMPLLEMALTGQPGMEDLTTADKTQLTRLLSEAFQDIVPEILNRYAIHFANALSDTELKTLIGFYTTDTGRKFVAAQVAANQALQKEIEELGGKAGIQAATRFLEWKVQQVK